MQNNKKKPFSKKGSSSPKRPSAKDGRKFSEKKHGKRVTYEKDFIFWCNTCNVPLIGSKCFTCGNEGEKLNLSQPADVRFCSAYERGVLSEKLISDYGCDPIGKRVVLLNKIPGDDKSDEVIVDGLKFGVLRFDLHDMDYKLDLMIDGAKVLLGCTSKKTVYLKKTKRHLSGKKAGPELIDKYTSDIQKGGNVLVVCSNLTGYGTSYLDSEEFDSSQDAIIKVNKIDGSDVSLNSRVADMDDIINANLDHIRDLGKNAMNAIKGIVNQKPYRHLPVYVSFSGGKDSLVVLDLAISAIKKHEIKAFFVNTGLEFPETVDFARDYCKDKDIDLIEVGQDNAFWENLDSFGPPAKDFRWCCKVCKLAPANQVMEKCTKDSEICLTIDGKRKHESFSRARISASEMNPFVPGQLNIFPIRDWRAIEVWLYIYWRKLDYNPLYDMGFERVGCHLCPAALSAEYQRLKELHPDMYGRWNDHLLRWAKDHGLSAGYIEHGLWRWRQLPPKMILLAEDLGIDTVPSGKAEGFNIDVTSGISPCKAGGFTIEGVVRGVSLDQAACVMNIVGKTILSEDLGMLLVRKDTGTVKFFSSGSILVTADPQSRAIELFKEVSRQLMRVNKCTACGICQKVCPVNAIEVNGPRGRLYIKDSCTGCGKCTRACVVMKYADRLLPEID